MKQFLLLLCPLTVTAVNFPAIEDVTFTQSAMSRKLSIGYKLSNGPAVVTIDVQTNGVSIGDGHLTTLVGGVNKLLEGGAYTVTWDAAKDWSDQKIDDVQAVVTAWSPQLPPQIMCLVPDGEKKFSVRYYTSTNALPDGGLANDVYKTERIVLTKISTAGRSFSMGSAIDDDIRTAVREVQHTVSFTNDYYLGIYELTQAQWFRVYGTSQKPYHYIESEPTLSSTRPMENVSYAQVRGDPKTSMWPSPPDGGTFLDQLRTQSGIDFDLPTDAQWEFAGRGGFIGNTWGDGSYYSKANLAKLAIHFGSGICNAETTGWAGPCFTFEDGLSCSTMPVGLLRPNAYGLYDMHGNVWEMARDFWVADCSGEDGGIEPFAEADRSKIIQKSGACYAEYGRLRVSYRGQEPIDYKNRNTGIRLWAPAFAQK